MNKNTKIGVTLIASMVVLLTGFGVVNVISEEIPFTFKWNYTAGGTTTIGPLAADANNDGFMEVFTSTSGKITCLNGTTGELIWQYTNPSISSHAPFELANLDAGPMLELVVACYGRTICLNAESGTVDWMITNVNSMEKHLVLLPPYVYISTNYLGTIDDYGRLYKLSGEDGSIIKSAKIGYPCWGGLSAADIDGDGDYELFLTGRSDGTGSKGMQRWDPDTLELIWSREDILCSSHTMAHADVNGDGIKDAIAFNQARNGIYVLDGETGATISVQNNLPMTGHANLCIADFDLDGNLELISCYSKYNLTNHAIVWDLVNWEQDADLGLFCETPFAGNVMGDSKLEIIGGSDWKYIRDTDGSRGIKIFNHKYELIHTLHVAGITMALVQDIDNDGLNELIVISAAGVISVYDTLAENNGYDTNSLYYGHENTGAPPVGKVVEPEKDIWELYIKLTDNDDIVVYEDTIEIEHD